MIFNIILLLAIIAKFEHEVSQESDGDLPSTSKCGKCDYGCDTECDLNRHEETIYEFSCDLCEFHSNVQSEIDHHNLSKHEFPCSECDNTYRTPNKLEMHTCKLEVINPEYGSLYTKAWLDGNGCNAVFCRKLSQEIAILHSVKCVSTLKTCCWTPYTVSMKKDSTSSAEQNHTRDLSKV